MLLLVESILLRKSIGGSFPLDYVKKAQDMTYPWGKEAYIVLLKSIQNSIANHLEDTSKFEAPTLEVPGPTYLCEKYTEVDNPPLDRVLQIEADTKTGQAYASIEEESVNIKLNRIIELMEDNVKSMKDRMSLLEEENMQLKARVSELEGNQNVVPHTQTVVFPTNVTQQNNTQPSSGTTLSQISQHNETQDFSPNLTRENDTQPSSGTPLSPMSQQNETQVLSPNETQQEAMNESTASPKLRESNRLILQNRLRKSHRMTHLPLGTQVFSPNLTQEKETETSTDETPSNPNQEEGKPDDETVRETLSSESLTAQTQVLQKETEVTNETPASPIAPKSIETQGFTPIQTQQVHAHKILEISKGTYEATESLTEIISANNKNKSERDPSDETPSEQKQAEENLQDTTEPTTEIISTDVSKTPPLTQQTQHLQTSAIDFSETKKVSALFQIGAEVDILSTDDSFGIWYPGKVVDLKLCEGPEKLTVEYTTLFADQQRLQDTITADKIRPATPTSDQKSFEMMDKVEVFYNNGWSSGQINMVLGDNTYSVYLYNSMETIQFKHSDLRIHREWRDGVWKMADEMPAGFYKGVLETQNQNPSKEEYVAEHIEGAFAMLNCRRNENAPWFHNYKIPKACFLPMEFLHSLLFHDLIYKKQQKRTITLYDCLQTENNDIDIPQVKQLAVLISALLLESFGGEVDKEKVIPFEVEQAQGFPNNTFRLKKDDTLAVSASRISLVSASRISLSSPYLSISDENPSPELSLSISDASSFSRSLTRALSLLRRKPSPELYLFEKQDGRSITIKTSTAELRYPIGSEPKKTISINQHSIVSYITTVKNILGNDEFNRIRGTFLGPVIKLGERSLKLSAKIVHAVLTKSIKTVKKHEAWFHFCAQPMRFSIREFHMVTGLKCSGEAKEPRGETERFKCDFLKGRSHTVKDVEKQLRNTRINASDERFCLAMLFLIESILLQKSVLDDDTTFTLDYVKIVQDIDVLMTYPWGRIAYELLLKSFQRAVNKNLDKTYEFSQVVPILDVQPSTPIFLCEKYFQVASPRLIDVLLIENNKHMKVTCILPPIPHDPEADVFIEDEDNNGRFIQERL
ncbi:hypothetical protein Bca4012_065553 [Brassica carinata]